MNLARVAAALRELADAVEADDELAEDRPSRPRRRPRTLKMPVRPAVEVDELAQARADRALRRRGFVGR